MTRASTHVPARSGSSTPPKETSIPKLPPVNQAGPVTWAVNHSEGQKKAAAGFGEPSPHINLGRLSLLNPTDIPTVEHEDEEDIGDIDTIHQDGRPRLGQLLDDKDGGKVVKGDFGNQEEQGDHDSHEREIQKPSPCTRGPR